MTGTSYGNGRTVLVSGASVAGPVLAFWLHRHGFRPTVVERAPAPRPGGQAVDVRGAALDVAERMGVLHELRAARTQMRGVSFVDADGAELMRTTALSLTGGPTDGPDVEILRDDLAAVLLRALDPGVEVRYGDTVTGLHEDAAGVHVRFARAEPRTFDLVVGADGLHSRVRELAFGPEAEYVRHLGSHLAVFTTSNFLGLDHWQVFHQAPGRMVGVYSARGNTEARVNMGFESPPLDVHHRDVARQQELLAAAFAGDGWEVPRMLREMRSAPDFYFDAMSQVHLERWSRGRVALVGDAGYCASPLSGQGTTLAMVGAYVLAGELAAHPDHRTALTRYEDALRGFVRANQELALTNGEQMRELVAQGADGVEQQIDEHWAASAATAIALPDYGA